MACTISHIAADLQPKPIWQVVTKSAEARVGSTQGAQHRCARNLDARCSSFVRSDGGILR
jgi:hypothetical protein